MTMSLFYVKEVQRKLQSMSLRCNECCKCFSKQRNLTIHERVHTGKKSHVNSVASVLTKQESYRFMKEFTQGKSLMNVNSVASVLV